VWPQAAPLAPAGLNEAFSGKVLKIDAASIYHVNVNATALKFKSNGIFFFFFFF